ncbi:hypothetical protein EDC04DRAFT_2685925 [Pisolithus marmoratus]|nr:hypothetical protein EDC04DRAFT_2685925 [Pisolithus marmoratus]
MVGTLPFLHALAVVGTLSHANREVSNALASRQSSFDPSDLPSQCQSPCQVISTMSSSSCDTSLTCLCASSIASELQTCMTCLVEAEPTVESSAQSALSSYNQACGTSLSLSTSSGSGSSSATTTAAGSSSTGSSSTFGKTGSALGLKVTTGGFVVGVAAALLGAFMVA